MNDKQMMMLALLRVEGAVTGADEVQATLRLGYIAEPAE